MEDDVGACPLPHISMIVRPRQLSSAQAKICARSSTTQVMLSSKLGPAVQSKRIGFRDQIPSLLTSEIVAVRHLVAGSKKAISYRLGTHIGKLFDG